MHVFILPVHSFKKHRNPCHELDTVVGAENSDTASSIREFTVQGRMADNDRKHLVSTYYVPGTVLSTLYY